MRYRLSTLLIVVAACDVCLVASGCYVEFMSGSHGALELLAAVVTMTVFFSILLTVPVGLLFAFYLMADAFSRWDRADLRASRGLRTPQIVRLTQIGEPGRLRAGTTRPISARFLPAYN